MADRTYESALRHLDSIQSNRHVTSLFSTPPPSSSSSSSSKPTAQDLNAQAIPEMLEWLSRAGLTQADLASRLRCIHVAGTKGKGSVCAYLTSILLTQPTVAGRVGTYTSPHLVSVRERIQLDGQPISRSLFAQYFFEVWDAFTTSARALASSSSSSSGQNISEEELQGPATKPFYFRFLTILALHAFLREGVRSAVVECGIGGEYDSTNILPADAVTASVVTQLSIDHVGMLGATVPEIAWHKAGVCKAGRKCFALRAEGPDGDATMRVLRQRAAEKGATLVEVDGAAWEGGVRSETGSLEGEFQKSNQALALLAAAEHLGVLQADPDSPQSGTNSKSLDTLSSRFASGLRAAHLRGRCETLVDGSGITWFIDGAHTSESLAETSTWFARKYKELPHSPKPILLFNQQERDVAKLLGGLQEGIEKKSGPAFGCAVFTRNDLRPAAAGEQERDLSVQRAAAEVMKGKTQLKDTVVTDNVSDAVEKIRAIQRDEGAEVVVLATGSLHLVGALLRTLEPDGDL